MNYCFRRYIYKLSVSSVIGNKYKSVPCLYFQSQTTIGTTMGGNMQAGVIGGIGFLLFAAGLSHYNGAPWWFTLVGVVAMWIGWLCRDQA